MEWAGPLPSLSSTALHSDLGETEAQDITSLRQPGLGPQPCGSLWAALKVSSTGRASSYPNHHVGEREPRCRPAWEKVKPTI